MGMTPIIQLMEHTMKKFDMKFKVSLNQEARDNGEAVEVSTTILLDDSEVDACIERGLKNRIIAWQSNVKGNWDKFLEDGFPTEIHFSNLPFASARTTTRPMTMEEMVEHVKNLPEDEKAEFIANLGK